MTAKRKPVTTALDSRSDQHIDAIVREILAGVPGRAAEIRLLAAADFGAVLDRRAGQSPVAVLTAAGVAAGLLLGAT